MPAKKYKVTLSQEERQELQTLVMKGKTAAHKRTHAQILLQSDEGEKGPGWKDSQISELGISMATIGRVRKSFVEEGLETALTHKRPYRTRSVSLDGEQEAKLIALACSAPPAGRKCWTMQLLADKLVELEIVESISDETVRTRLKKTH